MPKSIPDIRAEHCGTVTMLRPLTPRGTEWLTDHVHAEAWQRFGGAIACEPRYVADILEGAASDGMLVQA